MPTRSHLSSCALRCRPALPVLLLSLSLLPLACAPAETPPPEPEPVRVGNPQLAVTLTALPDGFAVTTNEGTSLELQPTDPERRGRMWIEVGERSDFGIQLDQQVWQDRESYAELPGGEYLGGNKLVSQLGEAYYSRGRFDLDGERREEVKVFAVHPSENRLLTLHYRYPAAEDSSERLPEALALLGAIEPGGTPTPETGEGAEAAAEQ